MLARVVNALLHALTNKTSRTLLVMLAALAIPFASPKLAALRVIRISRMQPREPAGAPESERGANPRLRRRSVSRRFRPRKTRQPSTIPFRELRFFPADIDPRVRAALREIPIADPTGHALDAFVEHSHGPSAKSQERSLAFCTMAIRRSLVTTSRVRAATSPARFGDSGHGFILIANPWEWYFHNDVFHASSGEWNASRLAVHGHRTAFMVSGGLVLELRCGVAWFGTATHGDFGRRVERFDIYYLEQPGAASWSSPFTGANREDLDARRQQDFARL